MPTLICSFTVEQIIIIFFIFENKPFFLFIRRWNVISHYRFIVKLIYFMILYVNCNYASISMLLYWLK